MRWLDIPHPSILMENANLKEAPWGRGGQSDNQDKPLSDLIRSQKETAPWEKSNLEGVLVGRTRCWWGGSGCSHLNPSQFRNPSPTSTHLGSITLAPLSCGLGAGGKQNGKTLAFGSACSRAAVMGRPASATQLLSRRKMIVSSGNEQRVARRTASGGAVLTRAHLNWKLLTQKRVAGVQTKELGGTL